MTDVQPTAEDLEAAVLGALTLRGASEFSGLSVRRLEQLIADGELDWFAVGAKRVRYVPRKAVIELIARLRAQHRARLTGGE